MARDFNPDDGPQCERLDPRSEDVGYLVKLYAGPNEPFAIYRSPAAMVNGTMLSWQDPDDLNLRHHLNLAPGQRVDIQLVLLPRPSIVDVHLPDEEFL